MAATIEEKDRNPIRPPDGTKISAIRSASPTPIRTAAQNTGDIAKRPLATKLRDPKCRCRCARTKLTQRTTTTNDARFTLIGTCARRMRQGFASDAPQLDSLWLRECV